MPWWRRQLLGVLGEPLGVGAVVGQGGGGAAQLLRGEGGGDAPEGFLGGEGRRCRARPGLGGTGSGTGPSPARWQGDGAPAPVAGLGSAGPPWHPRSPPREAPGARGRTGLGERGGGSAVSPAPCPSPQPQALTPLTLLLAVPGRPPQAVLQPPQGPGQAWGQGGLRQDPAPAAKPNWGGLNLRGGPKTPHPHPPS